MKISDFLRKNIKWNLSKDFFADLRCQPTDKETLVDQLHKFADRYFPQKRRVETAYTEFCLNEIALASPKTAAQKFVKAQFAEFWQTFLRLKRSLGKKSAFFPADDKQTRIEGVAKIVAQCTQFALTDADLERICEKTCEIFDFDEREKRNINNVVQLCRVNYFCTVAHGIFAKSKICEEKLAMMFDKCAVNGEFIRNTELRQIGYATEKLVSCVNCLGNSATKFFRPTRLDVKPFFFCNGRNVFDTFCFSKLGEHTAQFYSEIATLQVEMQYFLHGNCEIRRYTLLNKGKASKKITADFLVKLLDKSCRSTTFFAEGALCLAVEGENDFYCGTALVCDDKVIAQKGEEGRVSHIFDIPCDQKVNFALVTAFAKDMPQLADTLQSLNTFGSVRCPYLSDKPSANVTNTQYPLITTPHGFAPRQKPEKSATTFNFTYQLGNEKGATFLDNCGNCTTLADGFAFGVGGEKVFALQGGILRQVNRGKFQLEDDSIVYKNTGDVVCKISHGNKKYYKLECEKKCRILFYFPLEEKSRIKFVDNTFFAENELRKLEIKCNAAPESYTTDSFECNTEKLRYKLSDNLSAGTCLAICFAASTTAEVSICGKTSVPEPHPLVRESLVSTYLNYINDKNAFCLVNFLKRADALTLAAITFTNPQFVKQFADSTKFRFFYDAAGQKKPFFDRLAVPLALVYYANLTNDTSFLSDEVRTRLETTLFSETFSGRDLCIKALALKKASHVRGFDKTRCLVEYNNLKKVISNDVKLFAYAQAIGAVPMLNPSKERLKDLCNKFDIPKSWYYVSQLENLYGMSIADGTLNFAPKVGKENVLEQLTLNIFGKRIGTTFTKSTVQSLTMNGVQYFLPLKLDTFEKTDNVLEVRY